MSNQSIFSRVSQLVRANINDLIDEAEDPEKMLDQLVRDYTSAILDARTEVGGSVGLLRLTEEDLREAEAATEDWGRKAAAASKAADEASDPTAVERYNNLAKTALTKQISFERQVATLRAKVDADTKVVDGLKDGLIKMEAKLETLRTKRQELVSRAKMAQAQATVLRAVDSVNAADPTSELARFEDRIRQDEAQVIGMAEIQSESLDEQFADLDEADDAAEAEARLATLKGKTPAAV